MDDSPRVIITDPHVKIDEVWPVSTEIHPNGGIGIDWSADIGFGQFILHWGEDGKLHAYTECMDKGEDKVWTKLMLTKLVDEIIIDG